MRGISVLTFVLGAAVGATVSYFIVSKSERKKADEQIKAVTDKMAELKKDNDILRDVRIKSDKNLNKPYDTLLEPAKPETEVPDDESDVKQEIDYSAISKKNKAANVVIKNDDITEITEHEYFNYINNKNYSETTFTFYQGDNTLVDDESGIAVHNPERYVGASGVDAMSKLSVEETYFVDEMNEVVNCITISEDPYYDENTIIEDAT